MENNTTKCDKICLEDPVPTSMLMVIPANTEKIISVPITESCLLSIVDFVSWTKAKLSCSNSHERSIKRFQNQTYELSFKIFRAYPCAILKKLQWHFEQWTTAKTTNPLFLYAYSTKISNTISTVRHQFCPSNNYNKLYIDHVPRGSAITFVATTCFKIIHLNKRIWYELFFEGVL